MERQSVCMGKVGVDGWVNKTSDLIMGYHCLFTVSNHQLMLFLA